MISRSDGHARFVSTLAVACLLLLLDLQKTKVVRDEYTLCNNNQDTYTILVFLLVPLANYPI